MKVLCWYWDTININIYHVVIRHIVFNLGFKTQTIVLAELPVLHKFAWNWTVNIKLVYCPWSVLSLLLKWVLNWSFKFKLKSELLRYFIIVYYFGFWITFKVHLNNSLPVITVNLIVKSAFCDIGTSVPCGLLWVWLLIPVQSVTWQHFLWSNLYVERAHVYSVTLWVWSVSDGVWLCTNLKMYFVFFMFVVSTDAVLCLEWLIHRVP